MTEWDVGMPLKSGRGWLLYASGWVPYAAGNFPIFRLQPYSSQSSSGQALLDAVLNVLPVALLGVAVFWLASRIRWPSTLKEHRGPGLHQQILRFDARSANLLNHANYTAVDGVVGTPQFTQSTTADFGRRIEFGARLSF